MTFLKLNFLKSNPFDNATITPLITVVVLFILMAGCKTTGVTEDDKADKPQRPDVNFVEKAVPIPDTNQQIELVPVPGGTFMMGSEETYGTHEVKVDPFWIGKYEITWNQYLHFFTQDVEDLRRDLYKLLYDVDIDDEDIDVEDEFLEKLRDEAIPADVLAIPSPSYGDLTAGMGTDNFPAVNVTQYAAMMFTKWLTVKTGEFFRLPTEAEWEYACRAATEEPVYDRDEIDNYAWHRENTNRSYGQVGTLEPNALGIHDMLGNVAEWTLDQYHEDYIDRLEDEPAHNIWFKPEELYPRTARGSTWMDSPDAATCFARRGSSPDWKMNDPQLPKSLWWHTNAPFVGIRVVKPKYQPETVEEMEKYWLEAIQDYY